MSTMSNLQTARYNYKPKFPSMLEKLSPTQIEAKIGKNTEATADADALSSIFKNTYGKPGITFCEGKNENAAKKIRVGVFFSGGQAPGGHNVIAGLFDGIKRGNPDSELLGFLDGPGGFIKGKYKNITSEIVDAYRNTGGFDMIASDRTKIETEEQYASAVETVKKLELDALVVIGGDDSNTNAAMLAEHFLSVGLKTQVIGVPKTIDGDLKNEYIETSFGFDTASKTYAEMIGNIARDAASAKKYWHFIKLMGRSASHIALECALQTQPNVCLVAEEVAEKNMSLFDIADNIAKIVAKRYENGENFGIVLIPEGLIEFVPEIKGLIAELNDAMAKRARKYNVLKNFDERKAWLKENLSSKAFSAFNALPRELAEEFLAERDPHGNVQVSRIETEKLIAGIVKMRLAEMKDAGQYDGKFNTYLHFFGYEGRCAFPSNFDADYCYSLGYTAFLLIANGITGYISSVRNLTAPATEWISGGVPLTMMMNIEHRLGKQKPVIRKALVELSGKPFCEFEKHREEWAIKTSYLFPGAIQYFGPTEVCDAKTKTIVLEQK